MDQVVQIVGALLILIAYAAAQLRIMDPHSKAYLLLNLAGAIVLGILAWFEQLWGFLLLETVWAGVSLWSLVQLLLGRSLSGER